MNIFQNKEHYRNFKKAWAESINSPEAKSTFETSKVIKNAYKWRHRNSVSFIEHITKIKLRSVHRNTSTHHIIYNILRGKPANLGFTKVSNDNKKRHWSIVSDSFVLAVLRVDHILRCIEKYRQLTNEENLEKLWENYEQGNISWNSYYLSHQLKNTQKIISKDSFIAEQKQTGLDSLNNVNKFLKLFKGTVTIEMLEKINISLFPLENINIWVEEDKNV